jgi:hypothetical protein
MTEGAAEVTTETATTPALETADYLAAIADHLRANPQLTRVNPCTMARKVQIASYIHRGEPDEAAALVLWHDSLTDPQIVAYQWASEPASAGCRITGRTATGVELVVWDVVQQLGSRLGFEEGVHADKPITADLLREMAEHAS